MSRKRVGRVGGCVISQFFSVSRSLYKISLEYGNSLESGRGVLALTSPKLVTIEAASHQLIS